MHGNNKPPLIYITDILDTWVLDFSKLRRGYVSTRQGLTAGLLRLKGKLWRILL